MNRKPGNRLTLEVLEKVLAKLQKHSKASVVSKDKKTSLVAFRKVAHDLDIPYRSLRPYWFDESHLKERINKLKSGKTRVYKPVMLGLPKKVFSETARLFSCPVDQLVSFLAKYMPKLRPFEVVTKDHKLSRYASISTYKNEIYRCFDLTGNRKSRDLHKDSDFLKVVRENIKKREKGTVGVHAVRISWTKLSGEHDMDSGIIKKKAQKNMLVILAEIGKCQDPDIGFSLFPLNVKESEKAEVVRQFISLIEINVMRVQLVTQLKRKITVPTAVDAMILRNTLGADINVELSDPTRGQGEIRVPGKYRSEQELEAYLLDILNSGIKRKSRGRNLRPLYMACPSVMKSCEDEI